MPGLLRCTCGDYTRVLHYTAHEAAGALGTRHSLRPLFAGRTIFAKPRTHRAARSRSRILQLDAVIARSEATKQSSFDLWRHGLLRFARNDDLKTILAV